MSAQAFDKLEQQINMLIQHCQKLEQSNQDLQQQISALKEERNQRLHVANQTDQKLEAMISRLKTLEQQT